MCRPVAPSPVCPDSREDSMHSPGRVLRPALPHIWQDLSWCHMEVMEWGGGCTDLTRMEKPTMTTKAGKLIVYKGLHDSQGGRQNLLFQMREWRPREGGATSLRSHSRPGQSHTPHPPETGHSWNRDLNVVHNTILRKHAAPKRACTRA